MKNETIVINLLGGSGIGKSTNASRLFTILKDKHINVELAPEWCKEAVWENREKVFQCQPYIFGNQLYRIFRLIGEVDVVITDSPILLSAIYDCEKDELFQNYIIKTFNKYNNLNYYLNRIKPFNPKGRNEKNIDEAKQKDLELLDFLDKHNLQYKKVNSGAEGCEIILNDILNILAKPR